MRQKIKNWTHRSLLLSAILWMIVCFIMMIYSYYSWSSRDFLEGLTYSSKGNSSLGSVSLEIDDIDDGRFKGKLKVVLNDSTGYRSPDPENRFMIVAENLSSKSPPSWYIYDLNISENAFKPIEGKTLWESDKEEFYGNKNSASFPYDEYIFAVRLDAQFYDGKNKEGKINIPNEIENIGSSVEFQLDNNMLVRVLDSTEDYKRWADPDFHLIKEIEDKDHVFIIERTGWYKWFVLFMMSFLAIPIYFVSRIDVREIGSLSLQFTSTMVSVVAIRTLLLGEIGDFSIYLIDMVFLFVLLLVVVIPLVKVFVVLGKVLAVESKLA